MKNPFLKFYTSDWRADPALRTCSMAARGLWLEMICLMHEATPYGHLLVNGQSPTDTQLALLVGAPPEQIAALLGELESAGVFSRTRSRVIYSRKLTRMAKKSAISAKNGRKGGNPSLCNNGGKSRQLNPDLKGEDKPQKPEARSQIYAAAVARAGERAQPPTLRERLLNAMGLDPAGLTATGRIIGGEADMAEVRRWLDLPGMTEDAVLCEVARIMASKRKAPGTLRYFTSAMQDLSGAISAPPLEPTQGAKTTTRPRTGGQNDQSRFDIAHREYARRLAAGEIDRGPDPSDPFAGR